MKKLVSLILSAMLMTSCMAGVVSAEETNDKVEIKFRVGDSILTINDKEVEVETPYIAGEGTTLVPLRVITEAFGAVVDWEGETQKITLDYEDVNITLHIASKVAQINDHAETLLEAPVLTENGYTMVPLRFISETFGADVSYDDGFISVIKQKNDDGNTISKAVETAYIGDSYYKWSMDTPKELVMTDRSFDGLLTEFSDDDKNIIGIEIEKIDDEHTFEKEYAEIKDSFAGYTLIEAEETTDKDGNKFMHFQAKGKENFIDFREFMKGEYAYGVTVITDLNAKNKDMFVNLADSFRLKYIESSDIHDLSNVKDGYREFKDEKYKVSFMIPSEMSQFGSKSKENSFAFAKFIEGSQIIGTRVSLQIYSKSDSLTALSMAEDDRKSNQEWMNPSLTKISEVEETSINGISGYQYIVEIDVPSRKDTKMYDIFFEIGDYVYNFSLTLPYADGQIDYVRNSLKVEELDKNEIGKLLRNIADGTMLPYKTDLYTYSLPSDWDVSILGNRSIAMSAGGSDLMTLEVVADKTTDAEIREFAKDALNKMISVGSEKVQGVQNETINGTKYYYFIVKMRSDKNDSISYFTQYFASKNGKTIIAILGSDEAYYGGRANTDFIDMLKSIKLK